MRKKSLTTKFFYQGPSWQSLIILCLEAHHIQSESALATTFHGCIFGVHMNKCALLNNIMHTVSFLTFNRLI